MKPSYYYDINKKSKAFWKLFKIKPGFFIGEIERAFDGLKDNRHKSFFNFLSYFIAMGDIIRYSWMRKYILDVLFIKLKAYDISIKNYKSGFTIKFKEKSLKQIENKLIAERL